MFFPFIGLVLASTVSAKVIDIQVGGANLTFTPEAVVSLPAHDLPFAEADDRSSVRGSRRHGYLPLWPKEPYCDPVVVCWALQSERWWL